MNAHFTWARIGFEQDGAILAQVTHVTDGDTLWVRPLAGGEAFKLRLQGLDAPEICQDWGLESRAALQQRLAQRTVTVVVSRQIGRASCRERVYVLV